LPDTVWVTAAAGLNLRAAPVTGDVLKILSVGEKLAVLDREAGWLQVRTPQGLTGWVLGDYVSEQELDPGSITPVSGTVWVTAEDGLNLRDTPVSGNVLATLAYGSKLTLQGQTDNWLQVRTTDGRVGWVAGAYVDEDGPPHKGNVRGIHGSAGIVPPPRHLWGAWIGELQAMGIAWYKQLDNGDPDDRGPESTYMWARRLKQSGIEPIIRYYQGQMFPGRLHDGAFEKMERYASAGITWCEIGNEPNLDHAEWQSEHHGRVSWQDPFYPRVVVENWINDAERAVQAGARPGFYALAPTDWGENRPHPRLSSAMFYRRMFQHVAGNPALLRRFRDLFRMEGTWLAVHVATYEWPFSFNPFPPNQPPYDMALRGYEVPLRYMRDLLGLTHVTVMSTEGGVFMPQSTSMTGHARLESAIEHAQKTVAMFEWLQHHSPLQAMCPWLISNTREMIGHSDPRWAEDAWYRGSFPGFGPQPVVQAMKATRPTV
jgi:SH3-like domain-containing protein